MANQFTPNQAKHDDVNEENSNCAEVPFNNSEDTNTNAEASEETC